MDPSEPASYWASTTDFAAIERDIERAEIDSVPAGQNRLVDLSAPTSADTPTMAARSLLARVLGRLPVKGPRLLQFTALYGSPVSDVPRAFCVAAALHVGRVLQAELVHDAPLTGPDAIAPDSTVPRLYHGRLAVCPRDVARDGRSALLQRVDVASGDFEMVVVDTQLNDEVVDRSGLASAFSGTILVVRAGITTRLQMRTAARAVQQAGGLVLGVVLVDAPPKPSWLRWLGAR